MSRIPFLNRFYSLWRAVEDVGAENPALAGEPVLPAATPIGVPYVAITVYTPGGTPIQLDGVSWNADNVDEALINGLACSSAHFLFDGATMDRGRSQSATNAALTEQIGAALVAPPANWAINHTPVANTQATISRAAGAAGVRHIATGLTATFQVDTAGTPALTVVSLRDGASGAGTILWSARLSFAGMPVGDHAEISFSGLQIPGSAATAMTLEFSAAGGANTFETVALTGYDVGA